jgi:hypothetical protein
LENLKRGDHSEDLDVDGNVILKWILGVVWEGVDWMHVAEDMDQWRVVVNTVMKLGDSIKYGEFLD